MPYFFEHIIEQKRLFFLNFALRSTVPQASHFANSPLGDIPTILDGVKPACFFPIKIRSQTFHTKNKAGYIRGGSSQSLSPECEFL